MLRHVGLWAGTGICAWVLLGCASTNSDLDGADAAAGTSDAGRAVMPSPSASDECGNGLDDDGDRMVDEDCFCGRGESQSCFTGLPREDGVGICERGVQQCIAAGSAECGRWGPYEGDQVPRDAACDGVDSDCDGATDEGCPCSSGETRECEVPEFLQEPCRGGTQRCSSDGVWSECEGAVTPSAEVCDDGIDNDCDGEIDDDAFCRCRPSVEICDNGSDDDCDGVVDEPSACATCTPVGEICGNELDDDCDGVVDETDACPPPLTAPRCWYLKASNSEAQDRFGGGVLGYEAANGISLSADGRTLAVSAVREDSGATGVGGDQSDNSVTDAGAVYVFVRSGDTWVQEAYLKPRFANIRDSFGDALSLSADGNVLAVGAPQEDGDGSEEGVRVIPQAGAAYIFVRGASGWRQEAFLKASNPGRDDRFGDSLALSADATTLAVGAPTEDSGARGVDGDQNDNSVRAAGAVYVFRHVAGAWTQEAYLKAHNTAVDRGCLSLSCSQDLFGFDLAISDDGDTLAVGSRGEDSAASGVGADGGNDGAQNSGAVYVFTRGGDGWAQEAYIKASTVDGLDFFGETVSLTGDGNTLLVGACGEDSAATGFGGDESNNGANSAGASYLFTRGSGGWRQDAYIHSSNRGMPGGNGTNFCRGDLSGDGRRFVVGAPNEPSAATGFDGDQNDTSMFAAGAAYLFDLSSSGWTQTHYIKPPAAVDGIPAGAPRLTTPADRFANQVEVSRDGRTVAFSAPGEASSATGVDGDPFDNSAPYSGAVFVCDIPSRDPSTSSRVASRTHRPMFAGLWPHCWAARGTAFSH